MTYQNSCVNKVCHNEFLVHSNMNIKYLNKPNLNIHDETIKQARAVVG